MSMKCEDFEGYKRIWRKMCYREKNISKWYFTNENSINMRAKIYAPKKYEVKHITVLINMTLAQAFFWLQWLREVYLDFAYIYILHWLIMQYWYIYDYLHTVQ